MCAGLMGSAYRLMGSVCRLMGSVCRLMGAARAGFVTLSLMFDLGCAPSLPPDYVEHSSAARAAYGRGEYERAAEHWHAARSAAPNDKHREEALYRQAVSLQRAGRHDEARALLARLATSGTSGRSARAEFDVAYAELERGDARKGEELLERALTRHPDSGMSIRAALRLLDDASEDGGNPERAKRIQRLLGKLPKNAEVRELLEYENAKLLEAMGSAEAALSAYDAQVRRYPYPAGRYWSESLVRSARILSATDRTRAAVSRLRWMLEHRESSSVTGSYERGYSAAHMLLADMLRKEGDLRAARDEYRKVFTRYQHSRLRDDALWQASLCSVRLDETDEACDDLQRLIESFPKSRYANCSPQLCPQLGGTPNTDGRCHAYITRAALD